jgi:hypothetical protein
VIAVTVDFDDQPLVPPDEVDLLSFDDGVADRSRQSVLVAEREEASFELAAREPEGRVAGQDCL